MDMGGSAKEGERIRSKQESLPNNGPLEKKAVKQGQQYEVQTAPQAETATVADLMDLLRRQSQRCALSGIRLTVDTVALDHIVPIASGGGDGVDNLQLVDTEVNTMKGTLDQDRFLELCRRVSQWSS